MSAARITKPPKKTPRSSTPAAAERAFTVPTTWAMKSFTLSDYHRMIETGILREEERCEFINGQVLQVMPPNPPHAKATGRILQAIVPLCRAPAWVVRVQDPITLTNDEPQPDLFIAVGPDDRYDTRLPGTRDVVLVVEVSDTSLGFDSTAKLALYARDKIPQYWIVNLRQRRVEVYTQPRGGRNPTYRTRTDYGPDDSVPVVINGVTLGTIPVGELLP